LTVNRLLPYDPGKTGEAATAKSEYERLGAKVLSLPDVIAQSVGFMGPVFSSAFVIPLVVGVISASGKGGGVASPISVLIAAVGVFAIGWIVSSYAKEIHAAGSLYDYVTRGLGNRVGTAAGWLYYAGVTVLLTGLLLLIGGYLQSTIASEFSVNPLPSWAWTLIVIVLITAALYFGVRISTRSQLVLALVSIIVVTVFFITVIVKLGSANSVKPFKALLVGRRLGRHLLRRAVRRAALRRVRDRSQPGRGDRARRSASTQLPDLSKSTA
jgi:amino acid transporter